MKLYIQRFIHHIGGLPDFSRAQVHQLQPVRVADPPDGQVARGPRRRCSSTTPRSPTSRSTSTAPQEGRSPHRVGARAERSADIDLTENDLVFVTNGSCTRKRDARRPHTSAPAWDDEIEGSLGAVAQDRETRTRASGIPTSSARTSTETNWESATITTLDDKIPPYIERICQRDPSADASSPAASSQSRTPTGSCPGRSAGSRTSPSSRRPADRLGLRALHGQVGRLRQEADAGVHRRGDRAGVALPPGRPDRADPRPGRPLGQHCALHDALHHRLLLPRAARAIVRTWCRRVP